MAAIPTSASDITPNWLTDILDADVVAVASENLGEGVGVMGEVTRLALSYGDRSSRHETLIAKTVSPSAQNRDTATTYGFYMREVAFYQQVAHNMDLRVPTCVYADMAEGGDPFIILLEEVTGARQLDQMAGIALADAEGVIDAVVKLHATWWDNPGLDDLTWLPPMNNELYKGYGQVLPDLAALLRQQWGDRLDPVAMPWLDALTRRYTDYLDWFVSSGPLTFCHYDLRPDNILVEPDAVCLLDWQLAVRHRGTFDIAYFLGQNVPTPFRRQHEAALLRRYHDGLESAGVVGYSFDRCWDDYRAGMLMHLVSATQIQLLDGGNDRGQQLLDTMLTQGWQAAADLDAGAFLSSF